MDRAEQKPESSLRHISVVALKSETSGVSAQLATTRL
jgi:hypothetical protein